MADISFTHAFRDFPKNKLSIRHLRGMAVKFSVSEDMVPYLRLPSVNVSGGLGFRENPD